MTAKVSKAVDVLTAAIHEDYLTKERRLINKISSLEAKLITAEKDTTKDKVIENLHKKIKKLTLLNIKLMSTIKHKGEVDEIRV